MFKVFRKRKKETAAPPAPASKTTPESPPEAPRKKTTDPPPKSAAPKERSVPPAPKKSPEELCGIKPGMEREKIREHLAMLFRRHNRAAASLDEKLRNEAEVMLDAIVAVREQYLGKVK